MLNRLGQIKYLKKVKEIKNWEIPIWKTLEKEI